MDITLKVTQDMQLVATSMSAGHDGDHDFTRFIIERPDFLVGFACRAEMRVAGEKPYLLVQEDRFSLPASLTKAGTLYLQLVFTNVAQEVVAKSGQVRLNVGGSINAVDEADPEFKDGLAQLADAAVTDAEYADGVLTLRNLEGGIRAEVPIAGGGASDLLWRPTVLPDGYIIFDRSASTVQPEPVNIMGPPGMDGQDGKDGTDGKDGEPGRDGIDGQDGAPGRDGQDGAPGKDGAPGRDGVDGQDGAPGSDGKDGADGAPGRDGADGKSAYELAVDSGFVGTEAEWRASLRGQDGRDGIDGAPGQDGKDGADGAPGRDGEAGAQGPPGPVDMENSAANIKPNGTAAAGVLPSAARGDHVHPTDPTRAPLNSPVFTGTPQAPVGTDYTATRLRNFALVESRPASLPNGSFAAMY